MSREPLTEVQRIAAKITKEIVRGVEEEVRAYWREVEGLIYVREYTVKAHVRKRLPRKRKDH